MKKNSIFKKNANNNDALNLLKSDNTGEMKHDVKYRVIDFWG